MDALVKIVTGIVLVAFAVFLGALASTAVGALVGWIVGLVFDDTMAKLAQILHTTAEPYQIGAMCGFVGSFFRMSASSSK